MFRALGLPAKVIDMAACWWLEWRSRRMIREVEPLFDLLRQGDKDGPDVWVFDEGLEVVSHLPCGACERTR